MILVERQISLSTRGIWIPPGSPPISNPPNGGGWSSYHDKSIDRLSRREDTFFDTFLAIKGEGRRREEGEAS